MHGPSGLDMTIVLDGTRSDESCGLDGKGETPVKPPLPEEYREITLAMEEDGETLPIPPPAVREGQAEKESVESTPHSMVKPVQPGEPELSLACSEAEEEGHTGALEHLMDMPPSLPPSPPPMHPSEASEGPSGAGPSQSLEGHGRQDRDGDGVESESGQTEATDGNLVNAARDLFGVDATHMRPPSPITEFTTEMGWRVRLCKTPKVGLPLPPETRELNTATAREPLYDQNTIFMTFALRFLPR
eukprot:945689-Pleurochrysis_carterae.AAC.1